MKCCNRRCKRNSIRFVLGMVVVLFWSGIAAAGSLGMYTAKDPTAGTVVIDGDTYRVVESTKLQDLEGKPLTLQNFPEAFGASLMVEYEADEAHILKQLRLVYPPG